MNLAITFFTVIYSLLVFYFGFKIGQIRGFDYGSEMMSSAIEEELIIAFSLLEPDVQVKVDDAMKKAIEMDIQ